MTAPAGCKCGAGMPYPTCNPADAENQPRLPAGMQVDTDKNGHRPLTSAVGAPNNGALPSVAPRGFG